MGKGPLIFSDSFTPTPFLLGIAFGEKRLNELNAMLFRFELLETVKIQWFSRSPNGIQFIHMYIAA